jgi:predicted unusual protein kinase regulating ubiquinone biosynthesis (AarF/ABC1/UbiB family)
MALSLDPTHLKRYKDIARLFIKYGRSDLVNASAMNGEILVADREKKEGNRPEAEQLARDLEEMGPIYVKLGQILSSRPDILPLPYVQALSRLQDKLEPFSFAETERILSEDLGARMSKAFGSFDDEPLATASLGQVYHATLRDGREVAVKVQRPNIREQIADDMAALTEIAEFLDDHTEIGRRYKFRDMLEEFRNNLVRELDYQQEVRNLQQFGNNLREFPNIVIPRPIEDYSTGRLLTMEYIHGRKITDVGPLAPLEIDTKALAEELFRAYLQQILVDGIYHADPHPGNVFLTYDGRIALIDLGMVGHISPRMQEQLLKILLAISEGRSEEVADLSIKIGEIFDEFDETAFRRHVAELVAQQKDATVESIQVGMTLLQVSRISIENGIRVPAELTMLGKTLLNLDEVGRKLNPKFDPNESIRRNAAQLLQQRLLKSMSPGNVFAAAMEAKEFVNEFPRRINRLLDELVHNKLTLRIDAIDEAQLNESFEKVANRITVGLILAALIIGAAMLMRVETDFRIFGYPGLAMLFFLAAAGGGSWLVISIMLNDQRKGRKPRV